MKNIILTVGCLLLASSPSLRAEDSWSHEVAAYLWGAGMDGDAAVNGVPIHVDMSFKDILDNLELGFMGAYRASKDNISFGGDVVWMALGHHGRGPRDYVKGDLDIDQLGVTLDGTYGLSDNFSLLGGLRYNEVQAEVDVSGTGPLSPIHRKGDEQWVDPFIGVVARVPFNDRWSATLRGEVGGFGVGSDFAGVLQLTLRWEATEHLGVVAGYRYFDMNYETSDFTYDIVTSGPALGVITKF